MKRYTNMSLKSQLTNSYTYRACCGLEFLAHLLNRQIKVSFITTGKEITTTGVGWLKRLYTTNTMGS